MTTSNRFVSALLVAALAAPLAARAQSDLDLISQSVPPNVVMLLDTSGSMRHFVYPEAYLTNANKFWDYPTDNNTTHPAAYKDSIWDDAHSQRCYQLNAVGRNDSSITTGNLSVTFNATADTATRASGSFLTAGFAVGDIVEIEDANNTGNNGIKRISAVTATVMTFASNGVTDNRTNDTVRITVQVADRDGFPNSTSSSAAQVSGNVFRCWALGTARCTQLAALGFSCTSSTQRRCRPTRYPCSTSSTASHYVNTTRYDITFPDFTPTGPTDGTLPGLTVYENNYAWWLLNQVLLNQTVTQTQVDRMEAAKNAIKSVVNSINVNGTEDKVKFGLARYRSDANGGYVIVPASTGNYTTFMSTINNGTSVSADGSTPLSESVLDVGRYFAGDYALGTYPRYDRSLIGDISATAPSSAVVASPITSSCEKNFIIAVTDGLPTNDEHNHYGADGPNGAPEYNTAATFRATLGTNYDGDASDPGADQWLDDVTKYLYDRDLRPESVMSGQQNIITYTVGFNVAGTLLERGATKGGGRYFSNSSAAQLATDLEQAITEIVARNTSLTSATVPSSRTAFGDGFYTAYFLPGGTKQFYRGHLEAYQLDPSLNVIDSNNQIAIDPVTQEFIEPRAPFWDFDLRLTAGYASRTLYTTIGSARVPFTEAGITAAQLGLTIGEEPTYPNDHVADLETDVEELADRVIGFIEGADTFDEDRDGNFTEVREFVLGDIFHSNPVAVGPPLPFMRNEVGYGPLSDPNSFMARFRTRDRVLYVGSNDGLLHAVDAGSFTDPNASVSGDERYTAGSGDEVFGYMPGFLLSRAKRLPLDTLGKGYYVDGSPTAADVWIDYDASRTKTGDEWTTALVTPVRQGGEGVIALDVTDPNATAGNHGPYPRLMWEFTHSGLGETWSKPILTRIKAQGGLGTGDLCGADDGDGDCKEEWVAIFGAGYNRYNDPNLGYFAYPVSPASDPATAGFTAKGRGIFIVRMSSGAVIANAAYSSTDSVLREMRYAIPAEQTVLDSDGDGFADVIYTGDLGGQVWKWDISAVANTATPVSTATWPVGRIFKAPVATIAAGVKHYLSIYQTGSVATVGGTHHLVFASGERSNLGFVGAADPNDPNNPMGLYDENNRLWVIKDEVPTGVGAFPTVPAEEEPLTGSPTVGAGILTDVTALATDTTTSDAGYFFRAPDGEKFITNHIIFAGQLITLSYTPNQDGAVSSSCGLAGTTYAYQLDLGSGAGGFTDPADPTSETRHVAVGNGAPTDPRVTISRDANGNPIVKVMAQTSTGQLVEAGELDAPDLVDMIYWRQDF